VENFVLSKKSKDLLYTCHEDLISVVELAIRISPIDFSVICGARDEYAQNLAFAGGNSSVRYPYSKHNKVPSDAFDLAPYPIDWENEDGFCILGGVILTAAKILRIELVWGQKWEKLRDLGHFQRVS